MDKHANLHADKTNGNIKRIELKFIIGKNLFIFNLFFFFFCIFERISRNQRNGYVMALFPVFFFCFIRDGPRCDTKTKISKI